MMFQNLSKEHKQYIFLGTIVSLALLAGIFFGIKVSLTSISLAKSELQDISEKIVNAQTTLKAREKISENFEKSVGELKALIANSPPAKNYFSWAAEIVYSQARTAGIDIDAIDEMPNRVPVTEKDPNDSADENEDIPKLESYSLRVTAHGSYDQLVQFLDLLISNNPLLRIVGVDVNAGRNPEKHDMQIFLQWPFGLSTGE